MLRGRVVSRVHSRLSGSQNKWSMLKYRVDINEMPYHQEQFTINSDIDFSYLYPPDHPQYKPPGRPIKSEMRLMSKEERAKKYPEFKNWRDSWKHCYADATQGKKEYDQIAMMDFEREEEYYNFKLRTRRTLVNPLDTMNLVQQDLWKHKLHGVTTAEETKITEDGVETSAGETKKSINLLYEEAYQSEDDLNTPIMKQKFHGKQHESKGFTFQVDQDGNTNYDWASIWPTQRSFTDSLIPFDIRQGHTGPKRYRPDKFQNTQSNFSPNLLHLAPPVVKAQCAKLKEFTTPFPEEYKKDYKMMRKDFPIEIHTTSKCIAAPYQQSSNFTTRWATMFVNIGQLGLDERARKKLEIFIQGRPEEGQTQRLRSEQMRGHNGHMITYRDWTQQDYRMGDDRYYPLTGMIKLESARCPLKHQNEGYLMYLIEEYRNEANKIHKAENKGELKNGAFCYDKSRAKKRFHKMVKSEKLNIDAYNQMGNSIETMYNKNSSKMKIRGHDGFVNHVDNEVTEKSCHRQEAYNNYAEAMKELLLSDIQRQAAS